MPTLSVNSVMVTSFRSVMCGDCDVQRSQRPMGVVIVTAHRRAGYRSVVL